MFQLYFFVLLIALLLYCFLPRYLLSIYRRYRGDSYWLEVQPYKKHYPSYWVVVLFVIASLELSEPNLGQLFYLVLISFLLSLSWLDLKLRVLPNELVLTLAISGLMYQYFVINGNPLLPIAIGVTGLAYAKIFERFMVRVGDSPSVSGIGAGDIKLILALACWFDIVALLYLLVIACSVALLVVLLRSIFLKEATTSVAFAPYLSFATYIMWWYG